MSKLASTNPYDMTTDDEGGTTEDGQSARETHRQRALTFGLSSSNVSNRNRYTGQKQCWADLNNTGKYFYIYMYICLARHPTLPAMLSTLPISPFLMLHFKVDANSKS